MKKFFISFAVSAMFFTAASAQLFVGGSFGLNTSSSSNSTGGTSVDGPSNYNFDISPSVGYYLNSKLAVGAELGMNFLGNESTITTGFGTGVTTSTTKVSSSKFTIAPFARYQLLEMGNISVFGQGKLGLGFGGSKSTTGSTTVDGPSVFEFSLGVAPGVSYKMTEKIEILAFLGGISYKRNSSSLTTAGVESKTALNNFDINFYTSLGLGFIYKL